MASEFYLGDHLGPPGILLGPSWSCLGALFELSSGPSGSPSGLVPGQLYPTRFADRAGLELVSPKRTPHGHPMGETIPSGLIGLQGHCRVMQGRLQGIAWSTAV
eukprot:7998428-Pyramimonas_sp.AAC.1